MTQLTFAATAGAVTCATFLSPRAMSYPERVYDPEVTGELDKVAAD